jgi:hypothetical protein
MLILLAFALAAYLLLPSSLVIGLRKGGTKNYDSTLFLGGGDESEFEESEV